MTSERLRRGNSHRLTLLLLGVAVPPAATLVWLGLQLLQQDRALLAQRDLERRQAATDAVTRSLELSLAEAERRVLEGPVPDGMVRLVMSAQGMEAQPADRVLWLPVPRVTLRAGEGEFQEAERLEFQGNAARALVTYTAAARSPKPDVRAGALLRIARVRRQQKVWDEALNAYRTLASIRDVTIEGAPADLQARRASCAVLEQSGRTQELAREAAVLGADLLAGRWTLDRPAWELTARDVERWRGRRLAASEERRLFSAVAEVVWDQRRRDRAPPPAAVNRQLVVIGNTSATVLWRAQGADVLALAIGPAVLREWADHAIATGPSPGLRLSVLAVSGELLAGSVPEAGSATLKAPASETGLPWALVLDPGDATPASAALASRQRLLSVGLVAILLFFAGGGYFLWRVMQRELAVVRLQTDFVSAVSHEFRTPLTSLRHVTELLEENDDVPAERKKAFYAALDRNTARLHRLVESLLDFARMEGGRKPYNLQPVDAGALAAHVVADFQKEVAAQGFTIDLDVEQTGPVELRADASSLTTALWNLLDNAVKYSSDQRAVHVSVHAHPAGLAISVRDHGLGIPAAERREIFHRFVRGEQASRLGIKGTGLGLAMVAHIVDAHGGTIDLDSEDGAGSTFTIVLPVVPVRAAKSLEPGTGPPADRALPPAAVRS